MSGTTPSDSAAHNPQAHVILTRQPTLSPNFTHVNIDISELSLVRALTHFWRTSSSAGIALCILSAVNLPLAWSTFKGGSQPCLKIVTTCSIDFFQVAMHLAILCGMWVVVVITWERQPPHDAHAHSSRDVTLPVAFNNIENSNIINTDMRKSTHNNMSVRVSDAKSSSAKANTSQKIAVGIIPPILPSKHQADGSKELSSCDGNNHYELSPAIFRSASQSTTHIHDEEVDNKVNERRTLTLTSTRACGVTCAAADTQSQSGRTNSSPQDVNARSQSVLPCST